MSEHRILIVDDDPAIHEVLEGYLGLSGYEVLHAENGKEGLEKMLELPPDLLIVDVQMPVMDGFGLLEHIKANPILAGTPTIMLSSLERPNIKVKALQIGADDYVVKPFEPAELMARVAVGLRRSDERKGMEQLFSGVLGPVSLIELIQTMAHGDKSGRIELLDMGAEILIAGKVLASCRWMGFEGVDALKRVLLAEEGRFRVHFEEVEAEGPVGMVEDLLLSSLVFFDELREGFPELMVENLQLAPGNPKPQLEMSEGVEVEYPVHSRDLLLMMKGDLGENAELIRELMNAQLLKTLRDEGKN